MKCDIEKDCIETIFNYSNNIVNYNKGNYNLQISDIIQSLANNQNKYFELGKRSLQKMLNGELDNIIYRTVPGIMNQAILYKNQNIKIRLHDFSVLESETYLHNHVNPFASICLEGGYVETLWGVSNSKDSFFYEFKREYGGNIVLSNEILGKGLNVINNRKHYPGNILFNNSELFHTIKGDKDEKGPFTFIVKILISDNNNTEGKVYSSSKEIISPTTPIRNSNINEVESIMDRTSDWVNSYIQKSKIGYL